MTATSITQLLLTSITAFGSKALIILSAVIGLSVAFLIVRWGFFGSAGAGTTSRFSHLFPWIDHLTYKPYKGYNRLHSRKWNMTHTFNQ